VGLGWVFLKRTRILSRFHFTKHFIEFVLVETNQVVGSNSNVILTRQTSSMAAGSRYRAQAFVFCIQIWYMFPVSKCRGESDLGLCTTSGLAQTMPLPGGDFRQILRPNTFFNRKSPSSSRFLFASPEVVHRPRSESPLHFETRNIYQIRTEK